MWFVLYRVFFAKLWGLSQRAITLLQVWYCSSPIYQPWKKLHKTGMTDRHTDKQTDRQTDSCEFWTRRIVPGILQWRSWCRNLIVCTSEGWKSYQDREHSIGDVQQSGVVRAGWIINPGALPLIRALNSPQPGGRKDVLKRGRRELFWDWQAWVKGHRAVVTGPMIGGQIRLETRKGRGLGRQTVAGWDLFPAVFLYSSTSLTFSSTHRPILSILAVNFCGLCPAAPVWWSIMARLMAMMIKIQENRPIFGLNLHNIRFPLIEPLRLS